MTTTNLFTSQATHVKEEELLKAASLANNYIQSKAIQTEHGIKYSLEGSANSDPYFDEISLYSGSSGIIHFLLHFYEVTGDVTYLEQAEAAFPYIAYRWNEKRELSLAFSPWAFTTGYTGAAFAVSELYKVTQKEVYQQFVEGVVEGAIADAKLSEDGIGRYWTGSFGILADSGTFLFILYAADLFGRQDWRDFVVDAGRVLLTKSETYTNGEKYYLGSSFGDKIVTGFPIGAGGVAYTLLKLYQASGDKHFLEATDGIKAFYHSIYDRDGSTITLPHDLSKDGHSHDESVHYLGYCGGNAGLIRYLYEDYRVHADKENLEEMKQLTQSIVDLGAPEQHSDGYWNTIAYCCGTAGILNAFLSVWQVTDDAVFLDYAKRTAAQLLQTAEVSGDGIRWNEAYTRLEPENISAPIGFYEGAAGAGSTLLQLYSALKGDFKVSRIIDDPFPSTY